MNELVIMDNKQYTIKDIAQMAGVSAGTVDRVLHHRGEVSENSKRKVEQILKDINYQPNMYAIGLARKKKYHFGCFIPKYEPNDYWYSVARGVEKALDEVAPFNVHIDFIYYDHSDKASYITESKKIFEQSFDAVLIAPNYSIETFEITRQLTQRGTIFAFIDVNVEDTGALTYVGQDSFRSGYIAARILYDTEFKEGEIVLFRTEKDPASQEIQMQRRLEGFNSYIQEKNISLRMHEVSLKKDSYADYQILDKFFKEHPSISGGIVFNSQIYRVGEYLRQRKLSLKRLIGYDLLPQNVELLKSGVINYLIGQRPAMQGYSCIKMLTDKVVFKREVMPQWYMPVDILLKENIDYYVESYNL